MPSVLARADVEALWIAAAARLGFRVERTAAAFASSDGRGTIAIGVDDALDGDDAVAQLIFHELMHAATEGPGRLDQPDWGLDNVTTRDAVREHGCLRLSAHLADRHGLRTALAPTTDYRPYHDALLDDALAGDDDPAVAVARCGIEHLATLGWTGIIDQALAATAALLAVDHPAGPAGVTEPVGARAQHPLGVPMGPTDQTCATCAWHHRGGRGAPVDRCRQSMTASGDGARVTPDTPACIRWEAPVDCRACGACCREAYHSVTVAVRDPVVWKHPHLIVRSMRRYEIARTGSRCAALAGDGGGAPYTCQIYEDRPRPCREFEAGSNNCLEARRRVGLSRPSDGGAARARRDDETG